MDETETKKLINDVLDERRKRKVPKIFSNPQKAYDLFWMTTYLFSMALLLSLFSIGLYMANNQNDTDAVKTVDSVLSCSQEKLVLKLTLDEKIPSTIRINQLIQEITAKC